MTSRLYSFTLLTASGMCFLTRPLYSGIGHILLFHRVSSEDKICRDSAYAGMQVTPRYLEFLITFFKTRNYDFISLDRLCQIFEEGKCARRFVVMTLDDGYADNLTHAYPVFKKHSVPFAVYITTGFADRIAAPWWYPMEELVREKASVTIALDDELRQFDCSTENKKTESLNNIKNWICEKGEKACYDKLEKTFSPYGLDLKNITNKLMLDWQQVRALSKDPLASIGAHTVNHYRLNVLSESAVKREMLESKKRIETELGREVRHFSYPFGERCEVGTREFEIAKQCGFRTAVTTRTGNIFYGNAGYPECLPRIEIGESVDSRKLTMIANGLYHCIRNRFRRVVTS